MKANSISKSKPGRASETSRKQRDGTEFIGGYGQKNGSSDLLFIEGQLPEEEDRIVSDASPPRQLELALRNLETELERYGIDIDDV